MRPNFEFVERGWQPSNRRQNFRPPDDVKRANRVSNFVLWNLEEENFYVYFDILHFLNMSSGQFITDVVIVTGKDKCPPGYTIVSTFCAKEY